MAKNERLAIRLVEILRKLNLGEHLCVKDLAKEYKVSVRTVQNDLFQRFSWLPLEKDSNGCLKLEPSHLGIINMEDIKFFVHALGSKGLFPEFDYKLFEILLNRQDNNSIKIIGHNYEEIEDRTIDFTRLQNFIQQHQEIKFEYNNKTYSNIKPYKLVSQSGIWYLSVEDENSMLKSFHFKKLKRIGTTGQRFTPKSEILKKIDESDTIWYEDDNIETIVLKISPEIAQYFKRRPILPRQNIIEEKADGSLIIETKTGNTKMLIPKLMYWIPEIKIISPTSIYEQMEDKIKKFLNK